MSPNRHLKYSIITIKVNKKRLKAAIEKAGGILCLTADHGNSDDMYEHKKDGSVAMEAGVFFSIHQENPQIQFPLFFVF